MTKQIQRRSDRTQALIQMKVADPRAVKRLPMPGPGIKVRIPLHLWPAYQELYGLTVLDPQPLPPVGWPPVLLVKRTRRTNHERK